MSSRMMVTANTHPRCYLFLSTMIIAHLFSGTDVLLRMPTKMPINMLVILVKHSHVINKQDLVSYHFDLVRMLNEHESDMLRYS